MGRGSPTSSPCTWLHDIRWKRLKRWNYNSMIRVPPLTTFWSWCCFLWTNVTTITMGSQSYPYLLTTMTQYLIPYSCIHWYESGIESWVTTFKFSFWYSHCTRMSKVMTEGKIAIFIACGAENWIPQSLMVEENKASIAQLLHFGWIVITTHGGFLNGGTSKMVGLFRGKLHLEMDDS